MLCRTGLCALVSGLLFMLPAVSGHAESLSEAVLAGDAAAVQRLLESGADVNPEGVATPLYFAARSGNEEIVRALIEHGAEVNAVTRFGTPLRIAARGNHVGVVELLLESGADPNIAGGEYSNTPLHDAAERGAMEAARLLIEHGADAKARNKLGHPPIHLAARKGRDEMVALLREHGGSPAPAEPLMPGELAAADVEEGRLRALECGQCHVMEAGKAPRGRTPGPNLWNVVGREVASAPDYAYSAALSKVDGIWTFDELNRFLADTTGYVPGTNMAVGFEPERGTRVALIAYLRTLSDDPVPLE